MLPLQGKIEEFSICEIIHIIRVGRKTGTLLIEGLHGQISLYFEDGNVVYANPNHQREPLGDILVKGGLATRRDIKKALTLQRRSEVRGPRKRIGSILVSMGVITEKQLSEHVAEQIKNTVYLITAEKSGTFKFLPEHGIFPNDIPIELDIEQIILDGARRKEEWEIIETRLGDFDTVYKIKGEPKGDDFIHLSVISEWKVLSLINGRRSVNDIIEVSRMSSFDICKIMSTLVQLDLVEMVTGDANGSKPGIRRFGKFKASRTIIRRLINRIRGM